MVIPPMASRQAQVNARLAAEGRCIMHNSDVNAAAAHLMELPIGNVIPLCTPCCDWWKADAAESGDPASQPVRITDLTGAHAQSPRAKTGDETEAEADDRDETR